MLYWPCLFILLHPVLSVKPDLHKLNSFQDGSKCQYATGLAVGNRAAELECCERVVHDYYYAKLKPYNRYLSTFLESLQSWNCPQLQQECEQRTFNFSDFTSLIYLRFCNRSQMEVQCYDDIFRIVAKQNNVTQTTASKFNELVSKLNFITLSEEDLMKSCVQVAMYDSDSNKQGHYHEMIEPVVPFCSFVWCGFHENIFVQGYVTPWTCMPSRCRLNLVLYLAVNTFLALAIVIGNATILANLYLKKQDVQSIYRLSLAFADLIMGLVVIPIKIVTRYKNLVQSPSFTELRNVTGYVIANDSSLPMQLVSVELKELNGFYSDKFLSSYVSAFGFFNILSLGVSVTSLVAATLDRFVAIFCPLRYNNLKAILAAKITIASIWLVGFVFAILPIAIPDQDYSFVVANLASFGGKQMLVVYGIAFYVLVVLMWCSIIATYVAARPGLRRHDRQCQTDDEIRLLGTLGIMIVVFTICVVPEALTLIIGVYLPHVDLSKPTDFDTVAAMRFTSFDLSMGLVLASNSLWNCFIYSIRETNFRSSTKLLYKRIAPCLKQDQA